MTPEELDEARAKEAQRLWESGQEAGSSSWVVAARLAREGWTPPEPVVDPDMLGWRAWRATQSFLAEWDPQMSIAYFAGARMAREQERERAKVLLEYVEDDTRRFDGAGIRARDALAKYRGEA